MEARLTQINKNEALLYMGCRGEITPELDAQTDECIKLILETAKPRLVYRIFEINPDGSLGSSGFTPAGNSISELLKDCKRAVLFACTLGSELERLSAVWQLRDMAKAVIIDACASSAIENVCDNFCADLEKELSPQFLTDRFSPGYGDFPFESQREICTILDMPRKIGVSLTPGGLMLPQKSVTALIGIADTPQNKRFRGCAYCTRFKNCTIRKEQRSCGKN